MDENTFDANAAAETLLTEQPAAEEQQEQQVEEPAQENERQNELSAGLNELFEDGWTVEELEKLVLDEQLRADIQAGKNLMRAVNAYTRRQKTEAAPAAGAKRAVPTVRTASNSGAAEHNKFEDMSDKEFDAFYKQAMDDSLAGKKRRF